MTQPVDPEPSAQNPYAAPQVDPPASEAVPTNDVTFDELVAFVGPRHLYYWRALRRGSSQHPLFAGFNWAAAFFNVMWMLYRKMFREASIAFGGLLGVTVLVMLVSEGAGAIETKSFDRIVNIAFATTSGFIGNGLYLRRVRLAIGVARADEPDLAKRKELLAQRGGSSWLWPLVAVVVSFGLGLLSALP